MGRYTGNDPTAFWRCEHASPVLVEEAEGGEKKVARCLCCGQGGPAVPECAEEALLALRNLALRPEEARSA